MRRVILALLCSVELLVGTTRCVEGKSNEIFLSWIDGPLARFNSHSKENGKQSIDTGSDRLVLRSAKYALLIDSRRLDIPRLTTHPPGGDAAIPVDPAVPHTEWEPSKIELSAEINGQRCIARMRPAEKGWKSTREKELEYPVRIIESGNYFNHVALYDIEWLAADGQVYPGEGHVDLRAWGDRGVIEYTVKAVEELQNVKCEWRVPQLQFTYQKLARKVAPNKSATLRLGYRLNDDKLVSWNPTPDRIRVRCLDDNNLAEWNRSTGSWEIQLGKLVRDESEVKTDPPHLDSVTEIPFVIENKGDQPMDVPLRFIHMRHPIVGFVPMIFDNKGRPTGIPVQSSKNWHKTANHPVPYEGPWIHGSTRIAVPPRSKQRFRYVIVHTRWQGVPAASAGQLSLVGWGHNGFWTQMALGSWGEHVCIQPGRLQRRAFLTDVRPLFTLGMKSRKPWGWTSNVGGGDTMLLLDINGRYLPWGGVSSDFVANGPNLAHVRVSERAVKEALRLRTDTFLPRSDAFLRVYLRINMKVKREVRFSRAALFQLGSDYYNSNNPSVLSYGSGSELQKSESPRPGTSEYVVSPAAINGERPWVTLTHSNPEKKRPEEGKGTRGLVIHEFNARLGGKVVGAPFVAGYRTRSGELNVEIVPPPTVKKFSKGDKVEMLLELAVFPLSAADYYGEDLPLIDQLKKDADTWRMTAWEAIRNDTEIRVGNGPPQKQWPLQVSVENRAQVAFDITGGAGLITVQLTGLPSPGGWQVWETTEDRNYLLGDRYSEEVEPQIEFDRHASTYTATLSLRPAIHSDRGKTRRFQWVRDSVTDLTR